MHCYQACLGTVTYTIHKRLITFLFSVLFILVAACQVSAAENNVYEIDTAWWEETSSGMIMARWDKPEKATKYKVHLYKGDSMISVGAWHSCVANGYNFTKDIVSKGTGTYYFKVYPEKTGEADTVLSEEIEVDRDMLKKAKSKVTSSSQTGKTSSVDSAISFLGPGSAINNTGSDRWIQTPDNEWVRQKVDGSLYKNQWLDVDGKRYLFDSKGYMQKNGWRSIGSNWYYLGADGAVLINTTTPDGYAVDEQGRCVVDGELYTSYLGPYLVSQSTGQSQRVSLLPVTVVSIKAREYPAENGKPQSIELTGSRGVSITSVEYSVPYESWQLGRTVTITVKLAPVTNYYFKKGLKVNPSSNITFKSASGNEQAYTMQFSYLPKVQLAVPDSFYFTDDGELHWNKVNNAVKYSVKVRGKDIRTEKLETKKTYIDLSEYLEENASVEITACGNTNSKSLINSKPFLIENLDIFAEDHTIESPGWYQDKTTGYWYYFNSNYRMVTGSITENGQTYVLNDGSDSTLPIGAWIEGQ